MSSLQSNLPRHIAIIMDGNGRWAKRRFLPRTAGHKAAVNRVREIIEYCTQLKIEALTLFAFGRENWKWPKEEVSTLMGLFARVLISEVKKLHQNNIIFKIIGDRSRLSSKIQKSIDEAEKLTANNLGLKLQVAIDYSGQWDIAQATKSIVSDIKNNLISSDEVTEELISDRLQTKSIIDPDLLIRTSGEKRISNFMLWQLAYTELYFSQVLWPDFTKDDLNKAIESFKKRQRRYGKTSEQL